MVCTRHFCSERLDFMCWSRSLVQYRSGLGSLGRTANEAQGEAEEHGRHNYGCLHAGRQAAATSGPAIGRTAAQKKERVTCRTCACMAILGSRGFGYGMHLHLHSKCKGGLSATPVTSTLQRDPQDTPVSPQTPPRCRRSGLTLRPDAGINHPSPTSPLYRTHRREATARGHAPVDGESVALNGAGGREAGIQHGREVGHHSIERRPRQHGVEVLSDGHVPSLQQAWKVLCGVTGPARCADMHAGCADLAQARCMKQPAHLRLTSLITSSEHDLVPCIVSLTAWASELMQPRDYWLWPCRASPAQVTRHVTWTS